MNSFHHQNNLIVEYKSKIKTHKAGGIIVFNGLGVSESLQDGVGLQELFLQLPLVETAGHAGMFVTIHNDTFNEGCQCGGESGGRLILDNENLRGEMGCVFKLLLYPSKVVEDDSTMVLIP